MTLELTSGPHPSPLPEGEGAKTGTLTLLREWQDICASLAAGQTQLLIRKGGIAEGRAGFEVKQNFFGLLPTLFHQVKNVDPAAEVPTPPRIVSMICQLVDAFSLPSLTDLSSLAALHAYTPEQLETRQTYKPERPLHLLIVRPFRLKAPIDFSDDAIKQSCRSWIDAPLTKPMGGIEPVSEMIASEATIARLRELIEMLPKQTRIS